MALISTLDVAGTTHPTRAGNAIVPSMRFFEVDFAKALAAKGSALAAADIIEAITLPAGSVVLGAGAFVKTVADATTLTVHVGTGVDNDEWVASLDGKAAAGTYGADLNSDTTWKTYAASDTIDVTLATLTGTLTTGKIVVYALVADVRDRAFRPGLAALKS